MPGVFLCLLLGVGGETRQDYPVPPVGHVYVGG